MADRYDATIQLVVKKSNGRLEKLDTAEVLKPYLKNNKGNPSYMPNMPNHYYLGYDFHELFNEEETRRYTTQFYWTQKSGTAISGTYSWNFPMEALIRAMKEAGYSQVNGNNIRSSSFKGGCR